MVSLPSPSQMKALALAVDSLVSCPTVTCTIQLNDEHNPARRTSTLVLSSSGNPKILLGLRLSLATSASVPSLRLSAASTNCGNTDPRLTTVFSEPAAR